MLVDAARRLAAVPDLQVYEKALLADYTRFGIGGPADLLVDSGTEAAFIRSLDLAEQSGLDWVVLGAGTNIIASDEGFRGIVLRYRGSRITRDDTSVTAAAGAVLQDLVDFTIDKGLAGIHTMTGIPGWVGAAVYGNAGAYGRSIHQSVVTVRFFDGREIREFDNEQCRFRYRESIFKSSKDWTILETRLQLEPADAAELKKTAVGIRGIRDEKYPPTMKCAGSIFKNLLWDELPAAVQARVPASVIREGKVPSAWFLEQVGAKGMVNGGIEVATYHANLIYNAGGGTARQTREIIAELKQRVRAEFGFDVEEEVQYVGFPQATCV